MIFVFNIVLTLYKIPNTYFGQKNVKCYFWVNFLCIKILNFSVFLFCRGFGFVTFTDAASVDKVLAQQHHELDSKTVSLCFLHLHKSFIHVLSLMCFANCDVFFPFCLGLPGQAPIKVNRLLQSNAHIG